MNIIAVDDERLLLELNEQAIREALPNCSLSCFDDSENALVFAKETAAGGSPVDVAFLDVEMPEMNGIILAKKLKAIYEKTNIIFITGYSEYALDSYDVNASGYLLKPLSKETVLSAMEQLRYPVKEKRLRVQTFGNFEVFAEDKPLYFPRKRAKEVFAYLVYKQGASCTVKEIAAALLVDKIGGSRKIQQDINVLMNVLKDSGVQDVMIKRYNSLAVDTQKIDCDYYRALDGDAEAKKLWAGEFMATHDWAEHIAGYLAQLFKQTN